MTHNQKQLKQTTKH